MRVYFTVDTESSMGGAWAREDRSPVPSDRHVFCNIHGRGYGIPLLVEMMEPFDFKATYFVETLSSKCLGDGDSQSVFEYLLDKKQDVQLHIHPTFHYYAEYLEARKSGAAYKAPERNDLIGHMDERRQIDLLTEAIRLFRSFAGYAPTAFRAGNYAGSRTMLSCLHKLGIQVDSSFNPCHHPGVSFPDGELLRNAVQMCEGVWEIPVTVCRTPLPEVRNGMKFADPTSLSFTEIRGLLEAGVAAGMQDFVFVFHSFSMVKSKDETYESLRPNRIVIERMKRTLQYLADNRKSYQVSTMGNVAPLLQVSSSSAPLAMLPRAASTVRKAVQFVNGWHWV